MGVRICSSAWPPSSRRRSRGLSAGPSSRGTRRAWASEVGAPGARPENVPEHAAASEPAAPAASAPSGEELARAWVAHSPLVGALGMRLAAIAPDEAAVVLPYHSDLATAGDIVHGGAIMSLLDTAAALAAW